MLTNFEGFVIICILNFLSTPAALGPALPFEVELAVNLPVAES